MYRDDDYAHYDEQYHMSPFHRDLLESIRGERIAIATYEKLAEMAPNKRAEATIREIQDDEYKHLELFTRLYMHCFAGHPQVGKQPPMAFDTYEEGLQISFTGEIEAAHMYRDIYLKSRNPMVRSAFFEAMTDEMDHAMLFNNLLIHAKC